MGPDVVRAPFERIVADGRRLQTVAAPSYISPHASEHQTRRPTTAALISGGGCARAFWSSGLIGP